jgi:hypothetical protein
MAKKFVSAGEERASREHFARKGRAIIRAAVDKTDEGSAYSREILIESLEGDFTGHLQLATLTFDQVVQWSIAKSLQEIAKVLSEHENAPK